MASALSATNTSRMLLRKAVPRADHLRAGRGEGNAGVEGQRSGEYLPSSSQQKAVNDSGG